MFVSIDRILITVGYSFKGRNLAKNFLKFILWAQNDLLKPWLLAIYEIVKTTFENDEHSSWVIMRVILIFERLLVICVYTHIQQGQWCLYTNFDLYAAKCPHLWNELLLIMLSMFFFSLETHESGMSTWNKNISVALSHNMNCRVSVYDQNVLISVFSWFGQHLWNMPRGLHITHIIINW